MDNSVIRMRTGCLYQARCSMSAIPPPDPFRADGGLVALSAAAISLTAYLIAFRASVFQLAFEAHR